MHIEVLVTKSDFSLANLRREFEDLNIDYSVSYIEDSPEMVADYNIRHSPNVFINGVLAFRYQPSEQEIRDYIKNNR